MQPRPPPRLWLPVARRRERTRTRTDVRHLLASHLRTPRQAEDVLTAVETVAVTTMVAALASVSFSEVLPPSREDAAYGRDTVPAGPAAVAAMAQAHLVPAACLARDRHRV